MLKLASSLLSHSKENAHISTPPDFTEMGPMSHMNDNKDEGVDEKGHLF